MIMKSKITMKLAYYTLGVVLYYLFIVYLFNGQKVIFPVFTISIFFFSMFLSKREMIFSFTLLYIIWVIQLFLPNTILSINIIYLVFIPLTFWLGYFLKNKSWGLKIIYPFLLILVGIYGFSNFFYFIKSFNTRQNEISPKVELFSNQNDLIRLDTIQNKIIVLDFWTTNCGVCFIKFPAYEKIYLKYKGNPKVEIYAVNIPVKRDTIGYAEKRIGKYDYSFPVLYATSDTIPKSLGFNGYPHLIIIKNQRIRYNGIGIMGVKNVFVDDLEDEIELLLNEDL